MSCLMVSANLALCLQFALQPADYASNNLLALFMGNLFLYCTYYLFMKLYCGERPTWSCLLYLLLQLSTAAPSLYFFLYAERNSDMSPAESRHLNKVLNSCCNFHSTSLSISCSVYVCVRGSSYTNFI